MEYELVVDSREHNFVNNSCLINHISGSLDIGDFIIKEKKTENIVCLIERKKIEDYASSILDMRNKNQLLRINEFKKTNENCLIIYVIEGILDDTKKFYGKIKSEDVYSSICNKIVRDRIFIFQTENVNGTIKFINKIYEKFNKGINNKTEDSYVSTIKMAKKDFMTPHNWYIYSLAQIPSVSVEMAETIANIYPSMFELSNIFINNKDLLSNIIYKKKRIGNVISERIHSFLFPNPIPNPTPIPIPIMKKLKLKI